MNLEATRQYQKSIKKQADAIESLRMDRRIVESLSYIELAKPYYSGTKNSFSINDKAPIKVSNSAVSAFKVLLLKELDEMILAKEKELDAFIQQGVIEE